MSCVRINPTNQSSPFLRCGTCALSLGRATDLCRWCPINPSEVTEPRHCLWFRHVRQSEIHEKNCSRKTPADQLRPGPAACRASSKHTTSLANGCSCTSAAVLRLDAAAVVVHRLVNRGPTQGTRTRGPLGLVNDGPNRTMNA
jgi:hypothetical protein